MPEYILTVRLCLTLRDDAEAREYAEVGLVRDAAAALAEWYEEGTPTSAKLQRLDPNKPPRLIAKWSEGDEPIDASGDGCTIGRTR